MKKAIIQTGGKQYVVAEGETISVNLLSADKKSVTFEPLMIIDGKNSVVGSPSVSSAKVTADIVDADIQGNKVVAIRYKSKKRVHKVRGHRQRLTTLKIKSIG